MREAKYCKRLLKDSREEALAVEGFARVTVRAGNVPLVSRAVLYKKDFFAVLR